MSTSELNDLRITNSASPAPPKYSLQPPNLSSPTSSSVASPTLSPQQTYTSSYDTLLQAPSTLNMPTPTPTTTTSSQQNNSFNAFFSSMASQINSQSNSSPSASHVATPTTSTPSTQFDNSILNSFSYASPSTASGSTLSSSTHQSPKVTLGSSTLSYQPQVPQHTQQQPQPQVQPQVVSAPPPVTVVHSTLATSTSSVGGPSEVTLQLGQMQKKMEEGFDKVFKHLVDLERRMSSLEVVTKEMHTSQRDQRDELRRYVASGGSGSTSNAVSSSLVAPSSTTMTVTSPMSPSMTGSVYGASTPAAPTMMNATGYYPPLASQQQQQHSSFTPMTTMAASTTSRSRFADQEEQDRLMALKLQEELNADQPPASSTSTSSNGYASATSGSIEKCPVCSASMPMKELQDHVLIHFEEEERITGKKKTDKEKESFFSWLFPRQEDKGTKAEREKADREKADREKAEKERLEKAKYAAPAGSVLNLNAAPPSAAYLYPAQNTSANPGTVRYASQTPGFYPAPVQPVYHRPPGVNGNTMPVVLAPGQGYPQTAPQIYYTYNPNQAPQ